MGDELVIEDRRVNFNSDKVDGYGKNLDNHDVREGVGHGGIEKELTSPNSSQSLSAITSGWRRTLFSQKPFCPFCPQLGEREREGEGIFSSLWIRDAEAAVLDS
ncbi:hypothetical protein Goklo_002377 [Gossypium klotzschianum]|uniref:Uncharacterized protein n=1 Tax=Gossypium klotzschianum TaxID=34286 RepID=A0A7J8VU33_9ROSI|nr:hypothetical protein [Gossypium klotzschianum]